MRIVQSFPHPSRDLDTDGSGQTVRARALRDALRAAGHDVVTVSRGDDGGSSRAAVERYRGGGAGTRLLGPLRPAVRDAGRLVYGVRAANRLVQAVRTHRADVVLETHVAFSLAGARASATTGVPLVVDDLAPIWEERTFGVGLGPAADAVWRRVTRRARLLVAVNHPIRDALVGDVDPAKLVVVGNGWDPAWATARPRPRAEVLGGLGVDPSALVVVFVGSFLPWHRAEALVGALASAGIDRPWHLLLLGDGPRLPATLEAAGRHGVAARVTSTGHLPPEAVGAHLRVADIAVLPATNAYGNPMKLVEYLAAGTAVVAPRQATVTELCTHDRTAWLFTPDDPAALADALRTVATDDDLRRRLAGAAASAAADLRWDRQAARLVDGMRAAGIGVATHRGQELAT